MQKPSVWRAITRLIVTILIKTNKLAANYLPCRKLYPTQTRSTARQFAKPLSWHSANVASFPCQRIDVANGIRNSLGSPSVTVVAIGPSRRTAAASTMHPADAPTTDGGRSARSSGSLRRSFAAGRIVGALHEVGAHISFSPPTSTKSPFRVSIGFCFPVVSRLPGDRAGALLPDGPPVLMLSATSALSALTVTCFTVICC